MTDTQIETIYSGRSTNWAALAVTTALMVPLLVMAGPGSDASWRAPGFLIPFALVVAAASFNLLTISSVRAIAGPNGVAVHFGVFGWPRFGYPLARLQQVAIEVSKSRWAWGIYWTPRLGLMLTLRTGPALRLTLTNGRRVTISTPHPDDAVRAIRDAKGRGDPAS